VQAANAGKGYGPAGMVDVALNTRWGEYWLARIALLAGLAGALHLPSLWDDAPKISDVAIALGVGGLVLLPFSMISHAAAQPAGKPAAIATDWLHLVAAAIWVGGLLALLIALVYGTRGAPGPERRA